MLAAVFSVTARIRTFHPDARLSRQIEFARVWQSGSSQVGRLCVLRSVVTAEAQRRYAIVTSRRFSNKAVLRNRARRLLREAYRQVLPQLQPAWIILLPRHHIINAKLPQVRDELIRLCQQAGIYKPEAQIHE